MWSWSSVYVEHKSFWNALCTESCYTVSRSCSNDVVQAHVLCGKGLKLTWHLTQKSSCGKPHEACRPQCNLCRRGVPSPGPPGRSGVPPWKDLWLGYPQKGPGTRHLGKNLGLGYPPQRARWVWTDKQTENMTFPILRIRAVIIPSKPAYII